MIEELGKPSEPFMGHEPRWCGDHRLWERTAFPFADAEHVERQVREYFDEVTS